MKAIVKYTILPIYREMIIHPTLYINGREILLIPSCHNIWPGVSSPNPLIEERIRSIMLSQHRLEEPLEIELIECELELTEKDK